MIEDGRTLVVVADGRQARLFEEARRGGDLHERTAWLADLPVYSVAARPGRAVFMTGSATAFTPPFPTRRRTGASAAF